WGWCAASFLGAASFFAVLAVDPVLFFAGDCLAVSVTFCALGMRLKSLSPERGTIAPPPQASLAARTNARPPRLVPTEAARCTGFGQCIGQAATHVGGVNTRGAHALRSARRARRQLELRRLHAQHVGQQLQARLVGPPALGGCRDPHFERVTVAADDRG